MDIFGFVRDTQESNNSGVVCRAGSWNQIVDEENTALTVSIFLSPDWRVITKIATPLPRPSNFLFDQQEFYADVESSWWVTALKYISFAKHCKKCVALVETIYISFDVEEDETRHPDMIQSAR